MSSNYSPPPQNGEIPAITACIVEIPSSSNISDSNNSEVNNINEIRINPGIPENSYLTVISPRYTQRRPRNLLSRLDSNASSHPYSDVKWLDNSSARDHFFSILTSIYALLTIVFAIVIELSQKFTPEEWFAETLFYTIMYGLGLLFLFYCYLFMIHPGWYNWLLEYLFCLGWIKEYKDKMIIKTGHSGEGAGSLYLALGTLMFGSIGIVLFGLESFMCISNGNCYNYRLMNYFFAGLFTFVQMHFLFCNSKIAIVGSKNLAKLGTMHLLAVNVWTWFRFVLAKQMAKSIKTDNKALEEYMKMDSHLMEHSNFNVTIDATAMNTKTATISSFDYFGDFATFLTTCIIEYSLIGAAIMFVIWRSIDETGGDKAIRNKKKNSRVRIDCSSSSGGLFAGILFLIGSFVSIGIYSYFYQKEDSKGAILVFRLADLALYCFALIGCCLGLYRMRHLQYIYNHSSNSEFLDELLLFIGSMGEFIHCSTGMICWLSTQQEIDPMETYYIFVLLIRASQVALQSIFILMATRLRAISMKSSQEKPGKQFVTFLLIANVSLFFFHTLEGMKSVFGQAVSSERARPYLILISAVLPLTVFYRFHSSVCLAEIWKHSYNTKHNNSLTTPTNESSEAVSRCCSNCQLVNSSSETTSVERYAN